MTFFGVVNPSLFRQAIRVCTFGVVLSLPCTPVFAAGNLPISTKYKRPVAVDTAAQAKVTVTKVDFKRIDNGTGRLILQFDGKEAAPDLRLQGDKVIVDLGAVKLPSQFLQPMNVVDFSTPVQQVGGMYDGKHAQLVLSNKGEYDALAYQNEDSYVVEIAPKASTDDAVGGVSANSLSKAHARIASRGYTGRPVTFNFQDVPVRTVLQLIADESNLNIVASDSVQGNVTLRLVNVPWDQALDIILRAKGLDKRRDGNVVWVAPQQELARYEQEKADARIALENRDALVTEYIQINYHSATAIYKAITEAKGVGGSSGGGSQSGGDNAFLSPRGRLVVDERTNTLMISDIPKKIAQMRELISVIDRPVDQVLIESRIVVATDSFARELGAKFGVTGSKKDVYYSGDLNVNSTNESSRVSTAISNATQLASYNLNPGTTAKPIPAATPLTRGLNWSMPASVTGSGSLALSIFNAGYLLDLELSAMQQEDRGEVISNPRIVTTNQREAIIKQGKEIGYATVTGGAGGGAATPNVQFKEVVLELRVTPTITDDNRVFLNIAVKKDDVNRYIDLPQYGSVPEINRREITTAVLVDDGQTVVIGGVYEFTDRASVSKVPFLGDVPFLGNLFKKRTRNKDKAELLVFVTPRVLRVSKRS